MNSLRGWPPAVNRGVRREWQSFRIITDLVLSRPAGLINPNPALLGKKFGFDLTRATLNATLRYPWYRKGNPAKPDEFGAYLSGESSR